MTRRGRLVTSDDFHVDADELVELEAAGVIALDMETAAVAAVCEQHGCAWSVVRVDQRHGERPPDRRRRHEPRAAPTAPRTCPGVLKYVSTHPGKLPQLMQLGRDSAARGQERGRSRRAALRAQLDLMRAPVRSAAAT